MKLCNLTIRNITKLKDFVKHVFNPFVLLFDVRPRNLIKCMTDELIITILKNEENSSIYATYTSSAGKKTIKTYIVLIVTSEFAPRDQILVFK